MIATQSNFESVPSRVQCNGEAVLIDLRDPSREMLAAAALAIAGLVPPHLSYSHDTSCVTQEWLWSVGGLEIYLFFCFFLEFSVLCKTLRFRTRVMGFTLVVFIAIWPLATTCCGRWNRA